MTVKRELKAREVDKKLIGDRRRLRVAYEIEIKNLRAQKIDLEVRDQFPVSRHEQVKVKLEACDPKPIEQTDLNELKWRLTLEPNAKPSPVLNSSAAPPCRCRACRNASEAGSRTLAECKAGRAQMPGKLRRGYYH